MADLLCELGTEELPAGFVASAEAYLLEEVPAALARFRLTHGNVEVFVTPRRLAFRVADLAHSQSALCERLWGPPKSVAFGADGQPTKAAEAFARRLELDVHALEVLEQPGKEGIYLSAERREAGRPASEIISAWLPELWQKVPFTKVMRWGAGVGPFGRPVQWLLCLLGDAVLPCTFAGVSAADHQTWGHRVLSEGAVSVTDASAYVEALRGASVIASAAERRTLITEAANALAASVGAQLCEQATLDECVHLVEAPHVMLGSFEPRFLELPERLVEAVLTGHQKYLPLRRLSDSALDNRYLNVINLPSTPEIVAGNDRVLRARLEDAAFFIAEDQKAGLEARRQGLGRVVFHRKLGTLEDKVERLRALLCLAPESERESVAREAANLAKADLLTLSVGEFPELEGDFGGWLLRKEKPRVAQAIAEHYRPRGASDSLPESVAGAWLAVADRMDTLVGCLAVGEKPTGSQDPFALRRAALGILRIGVHGPIDVNLEAWFDASYNAHASQSDSSQGVPTAAVSQEHASDGKSNSTAKTSKLATREAAYRRFQEFVSSRFESWLKQSLTAEAAALGVARLESGARVREAYATANALEVMRQNDAYADCRALMQRFGNLAQKAEGSAPVGTQTPATAPPAEHALAAAVASVGTWEHPAGAPLTAEDLAASISAHALRAYASLAAASAAFFEEVLVMDPDPEVRQRRLGLVSAAHRVFGPLGAA